MSAFWIRLRRNWFRNLLAILQVALAIAAVTAVLGEVVPVLRAGSEPETVPFSVRYAVREGFATWGFPVFGPSDAEYLVQEAGSVQAATWYQSRFPSAIRVGDQRYVVRGEASVDLGFEQVMNLRMVAGNFFTAADVAADQPRVAIVSEALAWAVFGSVDVVGSVINVRPMEEAQLLAGYAPPVDAAAVYGAPGMDVQIIGVFAPPAGARYLGFPFTTPIEILLPVSAADDPNKVEGQMYVVARPGMDQALVEEVRALLSARIAGRPATAQTVQGRSPEILIEAGTSMQSLREAQLEGLQLLAAMGMAALVVSGIAMFTTTLANLAQRTRYIGLSRALGATRSRVVRDAVTEAALMAGLGGVLGVVFAYPMRQLIIRPLMDSSIGTPAGAVDVLIVGLLGVLLAMAVGAAAALYPAWTVARMSPAEAWREGRL